MDGTRAYSIRSTRIYSRQDGLRQRLRLRIIGKRRLIAQDRTGTDAAVPPDVAALADNRTVDLGRRRNSRVCPDNRIDDRGFLVDMDAGPKNRIADTRVRLYHAALADDRNFIDLGGRRDIAYGILGLGEMLYLSA